jgi:hypothetical protein
LQFSKLGSSQDALSDAGIDKSIHSTELFDDKQILSILLSERSQSEKAP